MAMLDMVHAALAGSGIEHHVEVVDANAYCAVLGSCLHQVCEALNSLGEQCGHRRLHVWFGREFRYDNVRPAESVSSSDIAQADSVIVGVPYRSKLYEVTQTGGVEILFVEHQGGRYVARRRRAAKTDWTSAFLGKRISSGQQGDKVGTFPSKRHTLDGEAVDVVYTWVDSADPDWKAEMRARAQSRDFLLDSSCNDERYVSRDELRYSLRSLWLYAPYVRNIFIVTSGHYPPWLDIEHRKIHLVPHRTIFPSTDDLPTFNSHAIEACLGRIPGLAEHFIYFNDDVFLGRETTVETFFTRAGLIKSRLSTVASVPAARPDATAIPTDWAAYNAAALIERDFGIRFERKAKHVPVAMKRSLLDELETRYSELVTTTRHAPFRSQSDLALPTMLAHFYGISTGQAVEWENVPGESLYADTGRHDFEERLLQLRRTGATFICLNATRHRDIPMDRQAHLLKHFLEEKYPFPSPFERQGK